ncbi:MAG: PAS domain S-box protein [Bacteroidales bacterium]|nr:PAS domain S-box protein [Bacteroidales bacterium]MCF8345512.1 PAS domain S-box protein [Bacteroidales bacterium]MCF8351615.1 PAS domain S-box protein [Bacteroidales bacterium]MCF8377532.1 PAS domain S-box protein [Bacteroidales bacterium]MCF8401802.1 PAS domain S-box protein [Bacteroidales bacterium]
MASTGNGVDMNDGRGKEDVRLKKLANLLNKYGKGDFSERFQASAKNDPIDHLGQAVNEMADKVKNKLSSSDREMQHVKDVEARIDEARLRYQKLFEGSLAPIFLIDPSDHKIVEANHAAFELTGYKKQELIGENLAKILPEDKKASDELIKNAKDEEGFVQQETTLISRKGQSRIINANYSNFFYKDKELIQIVGTDITDQRLAEEERERLNTELEAKNIEMELLLYTTSHDLRSPLVNVQGFNKELLASLEDLNMILQEEHVPDSIKQKIDPILKEDIPESIDFILSSTSKMDALLQGLLSLSRLGREIFTFTEIDMNKLVTNVIDNFEYQAQEENVQIDCSDLPPCKGDEMHINRVFSNLLGNALKYLKPDQKGQIRIWGEKDGKMVHYCVEDNGIGMAENQLNKIFNLFHKINPEKQGIGLGLNIVKQIIDRHGGSIKVESLPGAGSCFRVVLPAAS